MMNTDRPTLYLIRGVPGSGKSTLAQTMLTSGMINDILEADQFFINSNGEYEFNAARHKSP